MSDDVISRFEDGEDLFSNIGVVMSQTSDEVESIYDDIFIAGGIHLDVNVLQFECCDFGITAFTKRNIMM